MNVVFYFFINEQTVRKFTIKIANVLDAPGSGGLGVYGTLQLEQQSSEPENVVVKWGKTWYTTTILLYYIAMLLILER